MELVDEYAEEARGCEGLAGLEERAKREEGLEPRLEDGWALAEWVVGRVSLWRLR